MRQKLPLAALAAWLIAVLPASAQTYPAEAIILQQDVEARSGPSKTFFPTSKFQRGDKVLVIRECKDSAGWLEIKPPAGSFSWINGKYVKQVDARHGFVDAEPGRPAPVLPGSTLVDQPPNREIIKLMSGTIVIIVDRPLSVNGETWLPIQPHPSEVRYIPTDSVKPSTQVATNNSTANWTLTPNGYMGNAQLAEAERLLKTGDVTRAKQLLQQVANTATDQSQKVYALNRLASLQANPQVMQPTSRPNEPITAFSAPNSAPTSTVVTQAGKNWTPYGILRTTALKTDDGQPIYMLEDPQGRVLSYVATTPGKSLQTFLGRTIAVWGPTVVYRPDTAARLQYVIASHTAMP